MSDKNTTEVANLRNKTLAELLDFVNGYIKKHGPPVEIFDGANNTLSAGRTRGKEITLGSVMKKKKIVL